MADTPQPAPSDDEPQVDDALPPGAVARPLVERAEVVWLLAWLALVLILLGKVAAFVTRATSIDNIAEPPRFLTNINSAPATELALLPGVGPQLADRIVAEREAGGPFAAAEQLARVRGIGPKTISQVAPLVICGPAALTPSSSVGDGIADGRLRAAQSPSSDQTPAGDRCAENLTVPAQPSPVHAQSPWPAATAAE